MARTFRFPEIPSKQEQIQPTNGLSQDLQPENDWGDAALLVQRYLQLADIALRDERHEEKRRKRA